MIFLELDLGLVFRFSAKYLAVSRRSRNRRCRRCSTFGPLPVCVLSFTERVLSIWSLFCGRVAVGRTVLDASVRLRVRYLRRRPVARRCPRLTARSLPRVRWGPLDIALVVILIWRVPPLRFVISPVTFERGRWTLTSLAPSSILRISLAGHTGIPGASLVKQKRHVTDCRNP